MSISRMKMLQVSKCLIGLAVMFSPNGDYVRVKPQPETPAEK